MLRASIPMNKLATMTLPRAQAEVALRALQKDMYDTAVSKGWWDVDPALEMVVKALELTDIAPEAIARVKQAFERDKGNLIALMHSELSEGLENLRHGETPDDKVPEFKGIEAELADTIIRIFDMAEHFKLDVVGALFAKAAFNKTRPHLHGGKKF